MYGQTEKISADRAYAAQQNLASPPTDVNGLVTEVNIRLQDIRLFTQQLTARAARCADKLFGPMPHDPKPEKNLCERTPAEMEQMNRTVSSIREELYQLDAELQRLETL